MNKRSSLVAIVGLACWVGSAARAQEPRVLDERNVVRDVQKQNPELKAALARLESSRQDVLRLDERYAPVVQLEASASDITNPSLALRGVTLDNHLVQGINRSRTRRLDTAAEVRKHLVWGTDLALRVSANIFENYNYRNPYVACAQPNLSEADLARCAMMTPASGTTATAGTQNFVFPGQLGPGYGVVAKLTLKQPLLRGFGRDVAEADLNVARVQRTSAEHTRDRVASELVRDSLTAYWELWYATHAVGIQQAARELAARQRDDAQQRVNTGTLAPVEVLAFETELATRDEDVSSAEAEALRAQLELSRLMGGGLGEVVVDDGMPEPWFNVSAAALEEDALANSAEVRERASQLELARTRARTASDAQRHRLDLDSYVQFSGMSVDHHGDAIAQYGKDHAVGGFVGLTYETPVNTRAERAAAAKARADVEAADEDLRSTRQRVVAEARKAQERSRAQERGLALAEQTRDIAEKQLGAEQARFQSGTGTTLQVIEAEAKVRSAKLRVARARADLAETALTLAHLTGRLLAHWAQR